MDDRRGDAHPPHTHTAPAVPLLCLFGVVALLSSVTLVIKYVFQHSPVQAMTLAMIRVTIGFVFLSAITLLWDWRGLLSLGLRDVAQLAVVGFLGVFSYAVSAYGLMQTSVTHYALIYSLLPSSTAMVSVSLGKERLGAIKLTGIVLSLVGCVIAVAGEVSSTEVGFRDGDMYVLLFTVMMSAHIVFSAGTVKRFGVMVSNCVMFGTSALLLLASSTQWTDPKHEDLSFTILASVIYVGFATAGVFMLRCRALQALSPATVGTFHNLIPIATILLAYVFLGESIGVQTLIGATAVVAGAELVRRAQFPPWMSSCSFRKAMVRLLESAKPFL
jgi:drug/metabolite transporter (DMT)-like permease